jgi:hypothetical protein
LKSSNALLMDNRLPNCFSLMGICAFLPFTEVAQGGIYIYIYI